MAGDQHGISILEQSTSLVTPISADSAIQVIIGTAPVNMVANPESAVNNPVIAYSFKEAVEKMGFSSNFEDFTLCQSINASFQVFNVAPVILINVLDPEKHQKSISEAEYPIENRKAVVPVEGILLSTVSVSFDESDLIPKEDYTLSFDNAGHLVVTVLNNLQGFLNISASAVDPSKVTTEDIIGGYNSSTGQYTGLELVNQIYPRLGILPCQIIAPGWSHIPKVAAAMKAKAKGINGYFNAMAICDIDTNVVKTYEDAPQWKNQNGYTDSNMIALWPMVQVGEEKYYMSALWAALTASVDSQYDNIPYKSPSNELFRITGTLLDNGKPLFLGQDQGNLLNSNGICTAINMNGWRSWGNETSAYPGNTDVKDRFIACRRMMNWHGNTFMLSFFQKIDSPMSPRLIESIVDSENLRANGLKAKGAIADAKIQYIPSENSITDILDGKICFHQYLAFWTPAKSIVNIMEFDPIALQNALNGGGN